MPPRRSRSSSAKSKATKKDEDTQAVSAAAEDKTDSKSKSPVKRKASSSSLASKKKGSTAAPKKRASFKADVKDPADEESQASKKPKLVKSKSEGVPRTPLERKPPVKGANMLRVISWNVNGLRALKRNNHDELERLIMKESPDIVFLQETKLQDSHVKDFVDLLPGYESHWSSATKKKGYAGTAVFIKKASADTAKAKKRTIQHFFGKGVDKELEHVKESSTDEAGHSFTISYGLPQEKHDGEGRTIIVEHDALYLIGLYVPNSGQTLQRLPYRIEEWDVDLRNYVQELEKTKPVVFLGDLNVAHLDLDIYNYDAKHIVKSAGCTPQERESFSKFLEQGMVDTFRWLHPDARGQFTYWSMRTFGRQYDKGLRLDYFVASKALCTHDEKATPRVHDSYQLPDYMGSDHCPIGLDLVLP